MSWPGLPPIIYGQFAGAPLNSQGIVQTTFPNYDRNTGLPIYSAVQHTPTAGWVQPQNVQDPRATQYLYHLSLLQMNTPRQQWYFATGFDIGCNWVSNAGSTGWMAWISCGGCGILSFLIFYALCEYRNTNHQMKHFVNLCVNPGAGETKNFKFDHFFAEKWRLTPEVHSSFVFAKPSFNSSTVH